VRRRRGRRLLIVRRLLLLGRLFYGLLRCCFLRCHEHFTPLQCQNVNRYVCGISEFVQRVKFSLLDFSGRRRRGPRSRKPGPARQGNGMFVSKQWRPCERGHNLYNPSMPFAPSNRRTNNTRGPFASLIELWASRRDTLSQIAGW
jgi:hypothetical protein